MTNSQSNNNYDFNNMIKDAKFLVVSENNEDTIANGTLIKQIASANILTPKNQFWKL